MTAIRDNNAAADDNMMHVARRCREDDRRCGMIGVGPGKAQ